MGKKTPALAKPFKGTKASNISAESTGRVNIHVQRSQRSLFISPLQNKWKADFLRFVFFFFFPFLRKEETSVGNIYETYNAPHIVP